MPRGLGFEACFRPAASLTGATKLVVPLSSRTGNLSGRCGLADDQDVACLVGLDGDLDRLASARGHVAEVEGQRLAVGLARACVAETYA